MKESIMENNSNEVVEIDLKDLMFAVLHKWRCHVYRITPFSYKSKESHI